MALTSNSCIVWWELAGVTRFLKRASILYLRLRVILRVERIHGGLSDNSHLP